MISLVNQYIVVLDACVLLPMPLCDTLLRLAEEPALYLPRWSSDTLFEVRRNLLKWGYSSIQADRRIATMQAMFEDAEVVGYQCLMSSMANDPGDRHVLAAAVRAGAHAIVTDNVRHFPSHALEPYGLELMTADEFLVNQFHLEADAVIEKLEAQATKLRTDIPQLLDRLARSASSFSKLVTANYDR